MPAVLSRAAWLSLVVLGLTLIAMSLHGVSAVGATLPTGEQAQRDVAPCPSEDADPRPRVSPPAT